MDKETIHEQIEILIATLKEQHEGMKEYPKYVPQIDMDLFLENIRDLYEYSVVLGKMNHRERRQNNPSIATGSNQSMNTTEEPILNYHTLKNENLQDVRVNSDPQNNKPSSKQKKVNTINSGVLFDDYSPISVEIKQEGCPVIPKLDAINDIKIAIGINEKFVFMNELFDGSLEEYNASIDLLNNCHNASEAEQRIFLELQPKYHWEMNSPIVKNLLDLVERRFR